MSGFATAISPKSTLEKVISVQILRFFGCVIALPDLRIYFQTGVQFRTVISVCLRQTTQRTGRVRISLVGAIRIGLR